MTTQQGDGRDPHIGTTVLGRYQIEEVAGVGSFAVAYRATNIEDGGVVAVKIAHADLVHGPIGDVVRHRFETEANALAAISHPSLVAVYDAGETATGLPAIVMEFLDGVTLETVLDQRAPLSPDEIETVIGAVASALACVHAQDVVHRDVTPANIMLCRAAPDAPLRIPKLLDLGIAKIVGGPDITIGAIGTPRYLAKEQIRGEPTTLSDIYSLGATLWWAATGEEYLGDLEIVGEILDAHLALTEPVDVRETFPAMPAEMAGLLAGMLHPLLTKRIDAATVVAQLPAAVAAIRDLQRPMKRKSPTFRTLRKPDLVVPKRAEGDDGDAVRFGSPRLPTVAVIGRADATLDALMEAIGSDLRAVRLETAAEASTFIDANAVDAAVVSARLADGSGYRLVSALRRESNAGKLLRIVITAPHADPFRQWRRVGANAHVRATGPSDVAALAEVVADFAATQDVHLDEAALDQLFSLGARHARRALERFLAEVPVWLHTLESGESLERLETLAYLGAAIASRARILGAFELTGVARRMGHAPLGPSQRKVLMRELTQTQDAVRRLYMRMYAS